MNWVKMQPLWLLPEQKWHIAWQDLCFYIEAALLIYPNFLFCLFTTTVTNTWCSKALKKCREEWFTFCAWCRGTSSKRGWINALCISKLPPTPIESVALRLFHLLSLPLGGWLVTNSSVIVPLVYTSLVPTQCFLPFALCFFINEPLLSLSRIFSLTLPSLFPLFSLLSVCRIWWMTSAKSSSWRWAIWTEARTMEGESEVACRSGAAEFLLQEHTGVEIHAPTPSYITTAWSVNVVQKHTHLLLHQSINMLTTDQRKKISSTLLSKFCWHL